MTTAAPTPATRASKGRVWLKLLLLALAAVGLLVAAKLLDAQSALRQLVEWLAGLGVWGPFLFVLVYIAACVLLLPGWVLTLGAGAVFGVVRGSLYVSAGATLGATAAFLVGRYLARDWVVRRIEAIPRFKALDEAVASEGWKIVGLVRLSPVFPFNLMNYAFGVTRVSLRDYFLATWLGMMPATVLYVYVGSLARAAGDHSRTPAGWALYGIGLLATIAVTVLVTRTAKRALDQRITTGNQP
ncbi:MAG: TVP38/TMEM64 family protein [Verrucomicrobia bacterium]|nr:TVP38/TMEM64 family protein [Verrucomicrobiota bacterium]